MDPVQVSHAGGKGTGTTTSLDTQHQAWLSQQPPLPPIMQEQWRTNDDWNAEIQTLGLGQYTAFDLSDTEHPDYPARQVFWRFTSRPKSELIQITSGTTLSLIVSVIGSHSGGADKSNPDVKTSSLCRNPAALLGTAASGGGDKKVLNIINKAAYLYGIEVRTLAPWGVSVHPALARTISMIETEYVLVPTPGLPPYSLDDLATYKCPNPFKGRIYPDGTIDKSAVKLPIVDPQSGYKRLFNDPSPVAPDKVTLTGPLFSGADEMILRYAASWAAAVTPQSGIIQYKGEPGETGLKDMVKAAQRVLGAMR